VIPGPPVSAPPKPVEGVAIRTQGCCFLEEKENDGPRWPPRRGVASHPMPGDERVRPTRIAGIVLAGAAVAALALLLGSLTSTPSDGATRSSSEPLTPGDASSQYLGPIDRRVWTLAREVHGEQWMRVWTQSSGGDLSLRVEGGVYASAAEILAMLREVDLLPTWNRFCDGAPPPTVITATDLWASAGVRLPWPVPPQSLTVHALVARDPEAAEGVVAFARSPTAADATRPKGAALPSWLRTRLPLRVDVAVARMRPAKHAARTATRADIYLNFRLSDMHFHATTAPSWIVNTVVYIVAPAIWHAYLEALAMLRASDSRHAARLRADASGLYARVVRWSAQPKRSTAEGAAAAAAAADGHELDAGGRPRPKERRRRRRWPFGRRRS
jgi:hypothetical protein